MVLDLRRFALSMKSLFPRSNRAQSPGISALVACSAGVDSMVLLDLMRQFMHRHGPTRLQAVYLNHGQRPARQTRKDEAVIRAYCERYDIRFTLSNLPQLVPGASENEMRRARYARLAELAQEGNSPTTVFTAHHADDNLETFLFRLIRGAHPDSLQGIAPRVRRKVSGQRSLRLARPLLPFPKAQLIEYARQNHLDWHEDSTNQSTRHARNQIRAQLIPLLEELRPGTTQRVLKFFDAVERANAAYRPKPSNIKKIENCLRSSDGYLLADTNFASLKAAIDVLLDENSHRTTQTHWESLKRQLALRKATRTGGGESKTLQFPGGQALILKGNRAFWVKHS